LGKIDEGHVVEGVDHTWDKKSMLGKMDEKLDEAYKVMVESLQRARGMRDRSE
jgi:hypothetical protein